MISKRTHSAVIQRSAVAMSSAAYGFVPSSRGKAKLAFSGFLYRHQRSRGNNHYFRCEKNDCSGTATLRGTANFDDDNGNVYAGKPHTHQADHHRYLVLQMVGDIRKEAASTSQLPTAIVKRHRQNIDAVAEELLPSESALRQVARRSRRRHLEKEPGSFRDLTSPEFLHNPDSGEDFVLDIDGENRIVAVGSVESLRKLASCSVWHLDGTSKICPDVCYKICTIRAVLKDVEFPAVCALLQRIESNTEQDYVTLFAELTAKAASHGVQLNPERLTTNLDEAPVNAFSRVFTDS